ncbi:TPX2 (targeting protein for Xklp2) protein family [Arabidopsis thaliana]|uniref:TPX2 (Targeting protein for Xklp2) protein family n=1 Tax=Arabidopsis thaliana TaxID=3702 RepID=A0A1P8B9E9_ARATH|nr:TPX2 (targeting protein for Xklp2) protein family [Arabidopsis thaliana]ANM68217.1 TPX2 (targeting protein for Xklp2) protein family [Arabidopsis thaliana]|eukprot:NP_001329990.1 TPX2 (targeting protein for Xklp2) protein family [Arabidopsis thaliana]
MCTGKSSYTKSSPKFGKTSPTSSVLSLGSNGKGMTKVEPLKERAHDKTKAATTKNITKAPAKENKKPLEFKLHSGERAVKRAMFNYSVYTYFLNISYLIIIFFSTSMELIHHLGRLQLIITSRNFRKNKKRGCKR